MHLCRLKPRWQCLKKGKILGCSWDRVVEWRHLAPRTQLIESSDWDGWSFLTWFSAVNEQGTPQPVLSADPLRLSRMEDATFIQDWLGHADSFSWTNRTEGGLKKVGITEVKQRLFGNVHICTQYHCKCRGCAEIQKSNISWPTSEKPLFGCNQE